MIYLIIVWSILTFIFNVIGIATLNLLRITEFRRWNDRWIVSIWLGMTILATTLLLASLQFPLSTGLGIGIAAFLCGFAFSQPSVRAELQALGPPLTQLLPGFLIAAFPIAAFMIRPVTWVDTGLYQYSLVQWLHQVGTVPGIALLFANFGFNSIWFALAAPLNPNLLATRGSTVLNGLVLLIALLQNFVCWKQIWQGQARLSDWFLACAFTLLLLCSLVHPNLADIAVSPSPDLPVAFFVAIVSWTVLVVADARNQRCVSHQFLNGSVIPLILAVGATTIKLTALPLGLMGSVFYVFYNRRSIRHLGLGLLLSLLLLAPFLAAQTLTSGCPLFPSNLGCVNTPFALLPETSRLVSELTHDWTNWYGASLNNPNSLLAGFLNWLNDNVTHQLMVILAVVGGFITFWVIRWSRKEIFPGVFWVLLIQIVGFAFHAATTLFFRFMFPSLVLIPALLISMYGMKVINPRILDIQRSISQKILRPDRIWIFIASVAITLSFIGVATSNPVSLLVPPPLRSANVSLKRVNDFWYFSPQKFEDLCWSTQIPCAFEVTPDVKLRDPNQGIRAGFVRR